MLPRLLLLLLPPCLAASQAVESGTLYSLGVGKADITGPVVEIGMMGYASLAQKGSGLRQRIYSRAFIVGDAAAASERWVYIIADLACGDTAIRDGVLKQLAEKYGGLYHQGNVALVGTHSHAGPGAWLNYLLPQITTLGFDPQSYAAVVEGIVRSVDRAHGSIGPGYLSVSQTLVAGANINRSPYAYEANPAAERARYESVGGEVDKVMTALLFTSAAGPAIGQLNWFPVHGTSLYLNNTLIAGDNKGLAASLLEKSVATPGFVAGFSQANVGDTTPNTLGAFCQDTGLPCRYEDSTCAGESQQCIGRGPAFPHGGDAKSCEIIAAKQYEAAKSLLTAPQTPVSGKVRSLHAFVDFAAPYTFPLPNGTVVSTCAAALGHSFAAGTTDGPGAFDFVQNDPDQPKNPFWNLVGGLLHPPTEAQRKCQAPKPVLLDVGNANTPYAWTPNIVDFQLLRVGNLAVVVSPGEATTMAGRRWRATLTAALEELGVWGKGDGWAVIGAPANSYTHYIATPEEYAVQRYEGASTLYGPHTLAAYLHLTTTHAKYLADDLPPTPLPPGPRPPINTNNSISLIAGVVYDSPPLGKKFGHVLDDVDSAAAHNAGDVVSATFVGANPRNNLRLEGTFAAVEMRTPRGTWERVRDDSDWSLLFKWKRTEELTGQSQVTVEWTVDRDARPGKYRFRYYGDSKAVLGGKITGFEGVSAEFSILRCCFGVVGCGYIFFRNGAARGAANYFQPHLQLLNAWISKSYGYIGGCRLNHTARPPKLPPTASSTAGLPLIARIPSAPLWLLITSRPKSRLLPTPHLSQPPHITLRTMILRLGTPLDGLHQLLAQAHPAVQHPQLIALPELDFAEESGERGHLVDLPDALHHRLGQPGARRRKPEIGLQGARVG
ncbi:Neutral/alkaline non-lysosomal ceramidase-domain-containing protein [Sphaerosporella brunnea]|uniref:Neutral ceramidase n=1 Tax=Sphaerosporella brunnea TaxID=1250544 RepID=A0A5J5EH60_9PEZI|nr:Neutral/alkaline non-lysosomal ceramidase-domain-containing protein [Sphaerosporella brunnea]